MSSANPSQLELPLYKPRRPEESILYGVLREHLETFLARAKNRDRALPRFVERELRAYLGCGILAQGLVRVHCRECGFDRVVAFSCKGRGFCPSCGGRRMADTAAHLTDRVLPRVPVRQWVLSLPFSLRYRLAYDSKLAAAVLQLFVRCVFTSLRRRAREKWGVRGAQCGAVTFVQRFGGALNLNLHFHTLVLDGIYEERSDGTLRFRCLAAPDDDEIRQITDRIVKRIRRLIERRGLGPDCEPSQADPLATDHPELASLYAASVRGRVARGPRAGERIVRVGVQKEFDGVARIDGPRCASIDGVSLHADVCVPGGDRRRLEQLCRYVARPPVATERLSRLGDGRLLYRLKHRWRDGTTHVVFEPLELLERLAAIIPPPRFHMVRYHGLLGPAASRRAEVVPAPHPDRQPVCPAKEGGGSKQPAATKAGVSAIGGEVGLPGATSGKPDATSSGPFGEMSAAEDRNAASSGVGDDTQIDPVSPTRSRRLSWAELMRRVFAIDVLCCPRCGGRMRVLAAIHNPKATRAILECLELPSRAPPTEPPVAEALAGLDLEYASA